MFSAYGMIRHAVKRLPSARDLLSSVRDTKEGHPTAEAAMESRNCVAKNRISMSGGANCYAMDEEELAAFVAQQDARRQAKTTKNLDRASTAWNKASSRRRNNC